MSGEGSMGELGVFANGQGASFWHNEIVMELGSGDSHMTSWIYLKLLNYTLKV